MPFAPVAISPGLVQQLKRFARENRFAELYRKYSLENDTHANGFPDIYRLESTLTKSDQTTGITLDDVRAVAQWGKKPNQKGIDGPKFISPPNTLHSLAGTAVPHLKSNPLMPLITIEASKVKGIGPTNLSKVLRFALPQEYGAIDSRLVRVFGRGDPQAHRYDWITLQARKNDSGRWYIPENRGAWPNQYALWINILRFFASTLAHDCPHSPVFAASKFRQQGIWECADKQRGIMDTHFSRILRKQ